MARARVLLAEDHTAVAERLRGLLDTEFQVIATVSDGWGMVGAARALRPDVIVADISMPGIDGIEAATKILSDDPAARVVFVTVHDDAALVQRSRDIGEASASVTGRRVETAVEGWGPAIPLASQA